MDVTITSNLPGLQTIAASLETPLDDDQRKSPRDGQADTLIRATTLNFELTAK
mgnify:CR=1 FL=1